MATYTVNHAQMGEVIDNMGQVSGHINALLEDLNHSTSASLGQWTSAAREEFSAAQATWNHAAAQMNANLDRAQGALGSITENYAQAERAGSSMWAQ